MPAAGQAGEVGGARPDLRTKKVSPAACLAGGPHGILGCQVPDQRRGPTKDTIVASHPVNEVQ